MREWQLLTLTLVVSSLVHVGFFAYKKSPSSGALGPVRGPLEWEIETELISESDLGLSGQQLAPATSEAENKEPGLKSESAADSKEELQVANLLPQLPKFVQPALPDPSEDASVNPESSIQDSAGAPVASTDQTKQAEQAEPAEDNPEAPEKDIETEKTPAPKEKKEPEKNVLETKPQAPAAKDNDDSNTIDPREIAMRAYIDKLRAQQAEQKKKQRRKDTWDDKSIAADQKNRDSAGPSTREGSKDQEAGGQMTAAMRARFQSYQKIVQAHIRRRFTLPDAYDFKTSDLTCAVDLVLDPKGSIRKLSVAQSSGNAIYDQIILDMMRESAPLPAPPAGLVGKLFRFNVNSLSLGVQVLGGG